MDSIGAPAKVRFIMRADFATLDQEFVEPKSDKLLGSQQA